MPSKRHIHTYVHMCCTTRLNGLYIKPQGVIRNRTEPRSMAAAARILDCCAVDICLLAPKGAGSRQ